MQDKRLRTFDEWKEIIGELSPPNFEHLCYQLVKSMQGFYNVDLRDDSFDSGRDIDAKYRSKAPDGITEINERWRFECKKYSTGVSFDVISGKIHEANLNRIDKLVIMSNMHLTPTCKDELERIQYSLNCKIIDWTGVHFQDILFQYPHICNDFFPDEEIPQRSLDTNRPQELINITQKAGSHFGFDFNIKLAEGEKPPENVYEAASLIKEKLLNLKSIDLNIKSLIYQQVSSLFLSIDRKEDALLFLEESIKITPNNVAAMLNKGLILEKLDKLDESNECYDEILKIDAHNKFALNNKAQNLWKKRDLGNALILVERSLGVDPNFTSAISNKVSILIDLNRSEEALEFLNPMISRHDNSRILLLSKVNILIDLLDLKEAMKISDQLLITDPNDIDAINIKGVIYERNSKYQDKDKYIKLAIEWFEKTISKNTDYHFGWSNKIICLINNELIGDADELLNTVFDRFPTDPYLLCQKGRLELIKQNPKAALKYLYVFSSLNRSGNHFDQKNYIILI